MSNPIVASQWNESESVFFEGYRNDISTWVVNDLSESVIFETELDSGSYSTEFLNDRVRLTQLADHYASAGQVIELIGFTAIKYRDFYQQIPTNYQPKFLVKDEVTLGYGASFDGWGVGQFDSDSSLEIVFAGTHWPYASIPYPLETLEIGAGSISLQPRLETESLNFAFSSVVFDYNGDGFDDIYIATTGDDFDPYPGDYDRLFAGSPEGLISVDVEFLSNTKTFSHWLTSGDIDADGDLELLVGSVGGPGNTAPFLLQYANGVFEETQLGLPAPLINDFTYQNGFWSIKPDNRSGVDQEYYLSGHLVDANRDGFDDLVVGVDEAITPIDYRPALFLNQGDGSFSDQPLYLGIDGSRVRGTVGIGSGDYDGDGYPEFLVSEVKVDHDGLKGLVLFDDINTGFDELGSALEESFGFSFSPGAEFPYEFLNIDLNRDGHVDVVSSFGGSQGNNAFYGDYIESSPIILINDGTGRFQQLDMGAFEKYGLQMIPIAPAQGQSSTRFVSISYEIHSDQSSYLSNPATKLILLESESAIGSAPGWVEGAYLGVPGFNEQYYQNKYGEDLSYYQETGRFQGHIPYAPGTIVRGGLSTDVVHYDSLAKDNLTFDGGFKVLRENREDSLVSIERVTFSDVNLALDLDSSAGLAAKTLAAVIGEDGLSNKEYVGIGLELFDAGQSLAAVCELALTAVGATTNEDVVNLLYTNLYGEVPTTEVAQPFIDALNNGEYSKGVLASAAAELTDDLGVIDLVGLAETGIEYV